MYICTYDVWTFAGLRREGKDNVHFLVKWRGDYFNLRLQCWEVFKWGSCSAGTDETDFVNAKEAKAKIPQVILPNLYILC